MSLSLSTHFTLAEMTFTQVRGVDNSPDLDEAANLDFLCRNLLEPVRERFGPLIVTSGYRSIAVNRVVGGSITSMHPKGCAADVIPRKAVPIADIMEWLTTQSELPIDQAIFESGGRWLHLGTRPGGLNCRRQFLMNFTPGRFEPWNPKDPRVTR